jgi:hypothetical protein
MFRKKSILKKATHKTALAETIIFRKNIFKFFAKIYYKNFTFLPIAFILHECIRLAVATDEYAKDQNLVVNGLIACLISQEPQKFSSAWWPL